MYFEVYLLEVNFVNIYVGFGFDLMLVVVRVWRLLDVEMMVV